MTDYISRDGIMKEFADFVRDSNNSDFARTPTWNNAVSLVSTFPAADVVKVVRCKDCKHYDPYDQTERFYCYDGIEGCLPNDFCSYGERREE